MEKSPLMCAWFFHNISSNTLVPLKDIDQLDRHDKVSFHASSFPNSEALSLNIIILEFSITQEPWIFFLDEVGDIFSLIAII